MAIYQNMGLGMEYEELVKERQMLKICPEL